MKSVQNYDWDGLYAHGRNFTAIDTAGVSRLADLVEDDASKAYLDIGCGTGQLVRDMYHRGFDSVGVDSSEQAVKIAKESTAYLGNGIDFVNTDAMNLPEGTFSLITCVRVLAFLSERDKFYEKIKQRMHKQSTFVIITPDIERLPVEKQDIAIPDGILTKELSEHFAYTERTAVQGLFCYICNGIFFKSTR